MGQALSAVEVPGMGGTDRPTGPLVFTHPSVLQSIGPEVVAAIRLSRYSRSLGRYDSARSHLSSYMRMARPPLPVLNEVAASHITQGYIERAREVLDRALYNLYDEHDRQGVDYTLLCVQRVYVRARQTGLISSAVEESQALWNPIKDARGFDGRVEDVLFDIAGWHICIGLFASRYSELASPLDSTFNFDQFMGRLQFHRSRAEKAVRLNIMASNIPLIRSSSVLAGSHAHANIDCRLHKVFTTVDDHLKKPIADPEGVIALFDEMGDICRLYEDVDFPAGLALCLEIVAKASTMHNDTKRRVSALRKLRALFERTGDTFLLHHLAGKGLVACMSIQLQFGQALELMESLLHDGDHNRPTNPRFLCIYLPKLLQLYSVFGKREKALEYLKMAEESLKNPDLRETSSAVDVDFAKSALMTTTDSQPDEAVVIDILLKGIFKDTQEDLHLRRVEKWILLAEFAAKRHEADLHLVEDYLLNAEAVLVSVTGIAPEDEMESKFAISQIRMGILFEKADVDAAIAVANGMSQFFNNYTDTYGLRMPFGAVAFMFKALSDCGGHILKDIIAKRPEDYEQSLQEAGRKLEEAMRVVKQAKQDRALLGMYCHLDLALLQQARIILQKDFSNLDSALWHMNTAIEIYDTLRYGVPSLSGSAVNLLQMKQHLGGSSSWMCRRALGFCVAGSRHFQNSKDHTNAERFDKEGWGWIQKGKARGLVEVLSMGMTIPASTMEVIQGHAELLELVTRERLLVDAIGNASPGDEPFARGELQRHQQEMLKYPILANMIAARDGGSLTLDNLQDVTYGDGEPVVFVDWAVFTNDDSEMHLTLVVVKHGQPPQFEHIELDLETVAGWKTSYLNRSTLANYHVSHIKLKEMDALVAPLSRLTEPGELLVLIPTGPLHGLPLHALQVEDSYLIERNPVVYSTSHSVLRRCLMKHRSATAGDWNAAVTSVFEGGSAEETDAVHASVSDVAELFRTTAHLNENVTLESFSQLSRDANLIHYHGHVKLDGATIREQALVLYSGPNGGDESDAAGRLLTVPGMFSLPLGSPHVTIIGCGSGTEDIQGGDEPLGLVSAMLCAGATSVVGSLWPIRSADGRKFTERFYRCFTSSLVDTPVEAEPVPQFRVVHLAKALQNAVIEFLDEEETEAPYHWASFVLHGTWRCHLPTSVIHDNLTFSK